MDHIKSPPFSSPHRSSDKQHGPASRRDAVATNSRNTPRRKLPCNEAPIFEIPPESWKKASYREDEPLAQEGDRRDERGGGENPAMAGKGENGANRAEKRLPWVPRRKNDEPAVSTPAPLRSHVQQSKLVAAAAAIEAAAAAVAAIPMVRYERQNNFHSAMAHRRQVLSAVFPVGRYLGQYQLTWSGMCIQEMGNGRPP